MQGLFGSSTCCLLLFLFFEFVFEGHRFSFPGQVVLDVLACATSEKVLQCTPAAQPIHRSGEYPKHSKMISILWSCQCLPLSYARFGISPSLFHFGLPMGPMVLSRQGSRCKCPIVLHGRDRPAVTPGNQGRPFDHCWSCLLDKNLDNHGEWLTVYIMSIIFNYNMVYSKLFWYILMIIYGYGWYVSSGNDICATRLQLEAATGRPSSRPAWWDDWSDESEMFSMECHGHVTSIDEYWYIMIRMFKVNIVESYRELLSLLPIFSYVFPHLPGEGC